MGKDSRLWRKSGLPNILHVMNSERPDQYRGVPYLAPVVEAINNIRRYSEAEIMAAIIESFYTAFYYNRKRIYRNSYE